ncbi:hypothetical protein AVEN_201260-1 [Araneus ventricosus]|uniref:Uncharacterized protein n=1 Tax=Araneus ventricosus TaxID=182803 RepID=A0A4Y2QY95_ARAVE|nr:hypothetical protein AVEN_201260-1 [Araneus ventricosus]
MKNRTEKGQERMRAHVESKVQGMKEHVNRCIRKIEENVQAVKGGMKMCKEQSSRKEHQTSGLHVTDINKCHLCFLYGVGLLHNHM